MQSATPLQSWKPSNGLRAELPRGAIFACYFFKAYRQRI
jgi:hypothetical protein